MNYKGHTKKCYWKTARSDVMTVNPKLAKIIDKLDPSDKYWFVRASYPYGADVMKRGLLQLANKNRDIVPLTDSSIPKEFQEGLGYNLNSNPVSLIVKNTFEIFLPLSDRTLPISGLIPTGTTFGTWRILNPGKSEQPTFIWDMTAGGRSVFMLPKITEEFKHKKLKKQFGIHANTPRNLIQHFDIFRELANSTQIKTEPWNAEILYFSESWFQDLDDPMWSEFYQYFYTSTWAGTEFWRNKFFWDIVFSLILEGYEGRPNAQIISTAHYLLYMGIGSACGMGPVSDTLAGPFDLIQDIYSSVYELRNYPPIIMQPKFFDRLAKNSIYYSLQFPCATEFKPSSRLRTSIISDLHEIQTLLRRYARDLSSDKFNLNETSFQKLFQEVKYEYFHTGAELHAGMQDTSEMADDINLRKTLDGKVYDAFPKACLFGKGCIRLSSKI